MPLDLYIHAEAGHSWLEPAPASLQVNGKPLAMNLENGFARIRRVWKKGDTVEIVFPMDARRVTVHPSVKDDEGYVAVERGPLVYCAEALDNGGRALNIVLPDKTALRPEERTGLLGGIVVLTGEALAADPSAVSRVREAEGKDAAADDEEEAPPASRRRLAPGADLKPHRLVLIPYYAWAHRGECEMAVWLFVLPPPSPL